MAPLDVVIQEIIDGYQESPAAPFISTMIQVSVGSTNGVDGVVGDSMAMDMDSVCDIGDFAVSFMLVSLSIYLLLFIQNCNDDNYNDASFTGDSDSNDTDAHVDVSNSNDEQQPHKTYWQS